MNLNVDLSDVQLIEIVETGIYRAKLIDVEETESSAGNPMLTWTWEILDKENAGVQLKSFTSLLPNALFGLKGHLAGLGVTSGKVKLNTDRLIGRKATLTVRKIEDDGQEKNRVDKVTKYTKSTPSEKAKKTNGSKTDNKVDNKKSKQTDVLEPMSEDDDLEFKDDYSDDGEE